MSNAAQGPGWWQASDARWYPPEQHPDYRPPPPQPLASKSPAPTGKEAAQALTDVGSGCTKLFLLAAVLVVLVLLLLALL